MLAMNRLTTEKRTRLVSTLVAGCAIRSTSRMVGVPRNTVTKLLVDLGHGCSDFQNEAMRDVQFERNQVDEIWSFVGCKPKNVTAEVQGKSG
jgi:hypothetical protein